LDRFADFFRAPLFNKKYVSKEVHAIDSEHAKNVQDPQRRMFELAFSLANPESPVRAFHTGDKETLYNIPKKNGIDPVEELKTYFNSHYCPEKMRLVTYGSESLAAQLAEAKKGFSSLSVKNDSCKLPRQSYAKPEPWGPQQMGRFVEVRGTLPHAELWLYFALPDLTEDYRSQPTTYMDYVLGYGGQDSLSRVLQDNLGLVSSLSPMFDTNSAGTSLFIVMSLTEPGEKNLELVLDVFYSYLAGLRNKPIDKKLYSSLARINKLKWDWAEPSSPSDTASALAEKMTRLPVADLLSGDSLVVEPNSTLVSSLIKQLEPGNMNVIFVNAASKKGNSSLDKDDNLKILPHYGVKYSIQTLEKVIPDASKRWMNWLSGTETCNLMSRLPSDLITSGPAVPVAPAAIEGVPNEISLEHMQAEKGKGDRESELYGTRPSRIAKLPEGHKGLLSFPTVDGSPDVWYRSGWATHSPKAQLHLTLRPLKADSADELPARDSIRLSVFGNLLAEAMVPKMVDLTATGVSYTVDASSRGLSFTFGGFMPLMPQLIDKVLKEFNNFNGNTSATQSSRFKRVIQEIRQGLETWSSMPITYALQDRNMLLTRDSFSRSESLKALEEVTRESAASSVDEILLSQPMQFTSLVMAM
jgi:insulysin